MSTETQFQPPPIGAESIVKGALASYADRLIPGAIDELARLWAPQVDTLSPEVVAEVVKFRLDEEKWSGFVRPAPRPPRPPRMTGSSGSVIRTRHSQRPFASGSENFAPAT